MKETEERATRRLCANANEPAIQVICLGSGGGPSEDNVTGFLVRSTATQWSKNSVIAVDAGSHLASITRILENSFPLVSDPEPPKPLPRHNNDTNVDRQMQLDHPSPRTGHLSLSDEDSGVETPDSEGEAPMTYTTLKTGAFAGLPFPYASARANALHVVRECIATYLITHPHLDHVSGFVINTAAFHNTSRPKRLAALPFTINAIKTHLFNNIIWPNLTDEDGGVGLVTFQRLAEGGNIALGEGSGRGFIEVCDGLAVKGFKVSHGHCMAGPGHIHRPSNAGIPDAHPSPLPPTPTPPQHSSLGVDTNTRSLSFSVPAQSTPGTPSLHAMDTATRRPSTIAPPPTDHGVIDSTAYFIRAESTPTTPKREILIFGDVEPDSVSLAPRTAAIWAAAAPKIAAGILSAIFIEVSYPNAQADAVLFGHLAPRHLLAELRHLADRVHEARAQAQRDRDEARLLRQHRRRKRKRPAAAATASPGAQHDTDADADVELAHESDAQGRATRPFLHHHHHHHADADAPPTPIVIDSPLQSITPIAPHPSPSPSSPSSSSAHIPTTAATQTQTPNSLPLPLPPTSTPTPTPTPTSPSPPPLQGLTVIVIHVKDTMTDGPPVSSLILRELREGERALQAQGKGLGCVFDVSFGGGSYWF